jgi:hypothetical protein
MPDAPGPTPAPAFRGDTTLSMEQANIIALVFIPAAMALVGVHWAIWGWTSVREGFGDVFSWIFLPAFLACVVVHELLHAAGFALGGAPRSALHFGIDRKTYSPFAGCTAPLRATAYRVGVLLPALVLGVAPLAYGLAAGEAWATIWGAFMLLCAGGDFAALWAMRAVPGRARVLDHSERVGCRVVAD